MQTKEGQRRTSTTTQRLVAKGLYQIYRQTILILTASPVARLTSTRILYALSVMLNLKLRQLDVETAFLNADLEPGADIYIDPPEPIQVPAGKVFKLKKSLYGLKQAPMNWNINLNKYLEEIQFKRLTSDQCLYVKGNPHEKGDYVIVAIYVDDIIITSNNERAIDRVVKQFQTRYKMKDLGTIQHILGTEVSATEGTTRMTQRHFLQELLRHHGALNNKSFTCRETPISPTTILTKDQCPKTEQEIEYMKTKPFRQLLGAPLWLAINTRPDIMYAVRYVAKFAQNPGRKH